MTDRSQSWLITMPPGVECEDIQYDVMTLVGTKASLLQFAENVLIAAENQ